MEARALQALFPGRRRLLLCAIFREPERWWSLAELAGRTAIRATSTRRHLILLRDAGLVREKAENGKTWYQSDSACPVHAEVRSIVRKLTTGETILVVEDQPATARITHILLESWGYRVLEAHDAEEALSCFEQHAGAIGLLLTDVIMPGMSGPELAVRLRQRSPELAVVFMSGYPCHEAIGPGARFLPKPFNPSGLAQVVRAALEGGSSQLSS